MMHGSFSCHLTASPPISPEESSSCESRAVTSFFSRSISTLNVAA